MWISGDCESSDVPTWSEAQHPEVWPWADLLFCSSRRHINRGIISLTLKLGFVHILLASTWVADTADKWLFLPTSPSTRRSTNRISSSCNPGPFNMLFVSTTSGLLQTYGRAYLHQGERGWSKIPTCAFYCNFWPISVLPKLWHWLPPSGTITPSMLRCFRVKKGP